MRDLKQATKIVKSFEGLLDGNPTTANLDPYMDPRGFWTIGWGHLIMWDKRPLRGQADADLAYNLYPVGISMKEAEQLLAVDIQERANQFDTWAERHEIDLNTNQYNAMISFIFNVGMTNFLQGSIPKLLIAEKFDLASDRMLRYIRSAGEVLPGLVKRRKEEHALFNS